MSVTSDRLAQAMQARGVKQTQLAAAVGATQGAISQIMGGQTANSRLMPKIALHLGYPLGWLLGVSDNEFLEAPALEGLMRGGRLHDVELSAEERDCLEKMRSLGPKDRAALMQLLDTLTRCENEPEPTLHDKKIEYRATG